MLDIICSFFHFYFLFGSSFISVMYFPSLFACCVLLSAPGLLFPFLPSRPGNLSFFLYSYILFQHLFLSRSSLTLALLLLSYSLLPSLSIYLLLLYTVSPSPSLIFYCLSSSLSSFLTFSILSLPLSLHPHVLLLSHAPSSRSQFSIPWIPVFIFIHPSLICSIHFLPPSLFL